MQHFPCVCAGFFVPISLSFWDCGLPTWNHGRLREKTVKSTEVSTICKYGCTVLMNNSSLLLLLFMRAVRALLVKYTCISTVRHYSLDISLSRYTTADTPDISREEGDQLSFSVNRLPNDS